MVFDEEDLSLKRRSQYLSHSNGMRRVAQANSGRRMALCARSGTFIWTRLGRASCAKRRPDACARRMRVPQFNWTDSDVSSCLEPAQEIKFGGQKRGRLTRSPFVSKKDDPHVQLKKHRIIPLYGHAGHGNFLTNRLNVLTKCESRVPLKKFFEGIELYVMLNYTHK